MAPQGTETPDKVAKRIENAKGEIEYAEAKGGANFDAVIVNDDLDKAYGELKHVMQPLIDAALARQGARTDGKEATGGGGAATDATAAQIQQLEAELSAANASKDRKRAAALIAKLEALEA